MHLKSEQKKLRSQNLCLNTNKHKSLDFRQGQISDKFELQTSLNFRNVDFRHLLYVRTYTEFKIRWARERERAKPYKLKFQPIFEKY